MLESMRRAPSPFCSKQGTRERRCSRSPPDVHFCCTRRMPWAPAFSVNFLSASRRWTSCNCTTLDVVQLHKCLLEGVLKISEEAIRNQEKVSYCREAADALLQVRSGKVQVAFLMNPVRMEQVRDIAFAGEVLPQKSTDFYPKLLSGLTIYALE